jgi:hypothetical protein
MTERPPSAIEAELDAVRKRLSELESIQKEGARASARIYRGGFSKGLAFGLAPFIGALLLIGGTLYGQSDALFIDPRGWIGIGTNKPNATLDIAGNLNVSDSATVSNSLEAGTLKVTKDANLADTNIKGTLTTAGGNVGIGVASSKAVLDVTGKANTDKSPCNCAAATTRRISKATRLPLAGPTRKPTGTRLNRAIIAVSKKTTRWIFMSGATTRPNRIRQPSAACSR